MGVQGLRVRGLGAQGLENRPNLSPKSCDEIQAQDLVEKECIFLKNDVDYKNILILLVKIMLSSKLRCIFFLIFFYQIGWPFSKLSSLAMIGPSNYLLPQGGVLRSDHVFSGPYRGTSLQENANP